METDGVRVPDKDQTVREVLDIQIAQARKHVETLCIKKVKAEALNILDHPANFYRALFEYF